MEIDPILAPARAIHHQCILPLEQRVEGMGDDKSFLLN
jgi:hypothetical protein